MEAKYFIDMRLKFRIIFDTAILKELIMSWKENKKIQK